MNIKSVVIGSLSLGLIFSQVEMNYSYEMKYGVGKQVTSESQDTTDYSYFENLLDINTYFGDNIYLFTQLEYSNPPVFGYSRTRIDSVLNKFYFEYSNETFNMKLGNLYELYGRGLSFYTMQDQNVDYDNSIIGLNLKYVMKNNLDISFLIGGGDFEFRSNPAFRETDYQINNDFILGSFDYGNDTFGYLQFLYLKNTTLLTYDFIKNIRGGGSEVGQELAERTSILDFLSTTGNGDTLHQQDMNLNWNIYFGPLEIYIDKSWINYDKIHNNEVFGSRFYTSLYTELLSMGITYEYKNYYTPYLIKSISNPPICYREGNSILASRNAHTMNFGNEMGHQIDLNSNIFDNMNVAANLSLSHRHKMGDMESISIFDVLTMKDEDIMYDYYPFRQVYMEINGWTLNEKLYYKVGADHFTEFYDGKNINALTIPTHWVWKLPGGSSFTIYLETQKKDVKTITPGEYTSNYFSVSYSNRGKWIITGFYDQEIKDSKPNHWAGLDLSYKISSETQVSIYYGSQKGGLVCANGICAEQPGFEDGFKVTFRSLF